MASPSDSSRPEGLIDVRAVRLVQELSLDLSVEEVMRRLEEQQMSLSLEQVHSIRGRARARANARARAQESTLEETMMNEESQESPQAGEEDQPASAPSAEKNGGEAPRRGRKPGGTDTKAGYVRSLPLEVTAKQVVEQARGQGFEMSEGYVYAIRAKMKSPTVTTPRGRKGKKETHTPALKVTRKASPPGVPTKDEVSPPLARRLFTRPSEVSLHQVELELARLMLEVGVVRAEQVLQQLKERLTDFLLSPPQVTPSSG